MLNLGKKCKIKLHVNIEKKKEYPIMGEILRVQLNKKNKTFQAHAK